LRHQNQTRLTEILDAQFRTQLTSHWLARLQGKLPVAPVHSLEQALDSQFLRECGMLATVAHPAKNGLKLLANPLRFDGHRLFLRACAPLGHDTEAVLNTTTQLQKP
jgi:crotonobetainyl-CoA:carnitine CoA-transferase CaiB-like acyl-CoA transferase